MRLVLIVVGAAVPAAADEIAATTWKYPIDVVADADGTLFVADRQLPGIWKLKEGALSILHQGSKKFRTPLNAIRCLSIGPDGTLYAGDSATWEVYRVSKENGELTPLSGGEIAIPMAIAADSKENLFITDTQLQRVWKMPAAGGTPEEFLVLEGPRGIAIDPQDNVWVLSLQAPQLQKISPDGQTKLVICDQQFEFPHQIALRPDGTVLVSDGYARTIWTIAADGGKIEKLFSGPPLDNPVGIALQGDDLLVIDPRAGGLFRVPPGGMIQKVYPAE